MSLCASGIQTAVSKSVAACSSQKIAYNALFCGLFLSCALSLTSSMFLFTNAEWFAARFLSEPRCAELLKVLAFTITPACIHSCINGYYYGLQKAFVPSFTQLAEQISRMGFLWISVLIFSQNGVSIPLTACIWALAAGECMATLLSLTVFSFQTQPNIFGLSLQTLLTGFTDILPTAIPLTANRLLTSFLSYVFLS
jgi:stage V sporulation protein B